jgi:integrase
MAAQRITKTIVDGLKPGAIIFDDRVIGFGVRCQRAAKVYVVKTRVRGRQCWLTIGKHGAPWTVDSARAKARGLLGEIASGGDPAALRDHEKAAGSFAEFSAKYLAEYAATKKKPRSAASDRTNLELNILPTLGGRRLVDIDRRDILKLHHDLREKPGAANRCLSLLSKMFNLAELWGLRQDGSNPVRHIDRFPERKIERFLSSAEMAAIGTVLKRAETERLRKRKGAAEAGGENPYLIAAIRLLALSGARRSEILTAKWEYFDRERAVLWLPDSKSGAKAVPLGAPALEVLNALPRIDGNPYILPGHVRGQHLANIDDFWRAVRKAAKIGSCRVHDLRHSFASVGAASGDSLLLLGKLLGHAQPQTTARYSHLAADPVRAAADRISGAIAAAMAGKTAEVTPIGRRGARA